MAAMHAIRVQRAIWWHYAYMGGNARRAGCHHYKGVSGARVSRPGAVILNLKKTFKDPCAIKTPVFYMGLDLPCPFHTPFFFHSQRDAPSRFLIHTATRKGLLCACRSHRSALDCTPKNTTTWMSPPPRLW